MTKKDIGNLPFPEPGESICAEEDRRIAELEAEVERLKSMVNDMARWEAIAASYRDECDDERKYKHMYRAAAYREEVLSDRIAELEARTEAAEAALAKYQAVVDAAVEETEEEANLRRLADDSRLYEWPNKWQRRVDNAHGKRRAAVAALTGEDG